LSVRRRWQGRDTEDPGADAFGNCLDGAALAGSVTPFKDDDDPQALIFHPLLEHAELLLQPLQFLFVGLALHLGCTVILCFACHPRPPFPVHSVWPGCGPRLEVRGPRMRGPPGGPCPAVVLTSSALPARASAVVVTDSHPPPRALYSPTILSSSSRWTRASANSTSIRSRSASSTCRRSSWNRANHNISAKETASLPEAGCSGQRNCVGTGTAGRW